MMHIVLNINVAVIRISYQDHVWWTFIDLWSWCLCMPSSSSLFACSFHSCCCDRWSSSCLLLSSRAFFSNSSRSCFSASTYCCLLEICASRVLAIEWAFRFFFIFSRCSWPSAASGVSPVGYAFFDSSTSACFSSVYIEILKWLGYQRIRRDIVPLRSETWKNCHDNLTLCAICFNMLSL